MKIKQNRKKTLSMKNIHLKRSNTMKRIFLTLILALGLVGLSPSPMLLAADHKDNHNTYQFLVGEDISEPDVATAPDGSTVTLSGTGTFKAGPNKTASGGGTYTVKDPAGNVVASGTWTVTGILSFVDYGADPVETTLHGGQAKLAVNLVDYD